MDDDEYLSGDERNRDSDVEGEDRVEKALKKGGGEDDGNDSESEGEEDEGETGEKRVKYAHDEEGNVVEDTLGAPRPDESFLKKYIKYGYDLDLELEEDQTYLQWNSWYFQNGDVYEGTTFDDQFHGRGVLETPTSGIYAGEFYHNKASGHGVLYKRLDLVEKVEDEKTAASTATAPGSGSRETAAAEGTTSPEGDDVAAIFDTSPEAYEEPVISPDAEELYGPPEPDPALELFNQQTDSILGVTDQKLDYIKDLEEAVLFIKERRLEKRINAEIPDEEVEEDVKRWEAEEREALAPEYNPFIVEYTSEEVMRNSDPPDAEDVADLQMAKAAMDEAAQLQEDDGYDSDDGIDEDGWVVERDDDDREVTKPKEEEGVRMATDEEWEDFLDVEKSFRETKEVLEAPDDRDREPDINKDLADETNRLEQELESLDMTQTEKRMLKDHFRKWNRYRGAIVWSGQFENGRPHGCGVLSIARLEFPGKMDQELFMPAVKTSASVDDCVYDAALWHAGLGEVSSLKAQMFKFKPEGMVQVKERPILQTHPYMYDEGDEWMAPGFISEYFPVPKYLQKTVKKMDAERELWLGSFIRAPLRLPGPAELEHQYRKLMFEQPVSFVDEETGDEYIYDPKYKRLISCDKDSNGDIKNLRAMIIDEAQAMREGKQFGVWDDIPTGLEDVVSMKLPEKPPSTDPFEALDWALDLKEKDMEEEYKRAVVAVKKEKEKMKQDTKTEFEKNKLDAEEKLKEAREKAARAKETAEETWAERLEALFTRRGGGNGGTGGGNGEEEESEEEEDEEEEDEDQEEEKGGGTGGLKMSGRSDGVLEDEQAAPYKNDEEESEGEDSGDEGSDDEGDKQKKRVRGKKSETVAMAAPEGAASSPHSITGSGPTAFASISMGALALQNSAAFVALASKSQRIVQQVFDRAARSVSRFGSIPRLSRQSKPALASPQIGREAMASVARVAVAKWRLEVARESARFCKRAPLRRVGDASLLNSQRSGFQRVGGPVSDFADERCEKNDYFWMGSMAGGDGSTCMSAIPPTTTARTLSRRVQKSQHKEEDEWKSWKATNEYLQRDDLPVLCLALPVC